MKYNEIFLNLRKRLSTILFCDLMDTMERTPAIRSAFIVLDLLNKKTDYERLAFTPFLRDVRDFIADEAELFENDMIRTMLIMTFDQHFSDIDPANARPSNQPDAVEEDDFYIDADEVEEIKMRMPPPKLEVPPIISAGKSVDPRILALQKLTAKTRAHTLNAIAHLYKNYFDEANGQFAKLIASQSSIFNYFNYTVINVYLLNELKSAADTYCKTPSSNVRNDDDDYVTTTYEALMAIIKKGKQLQPENKEIKNSLFYVLTQFETQIQDLNDDLESLDQHAAELRATIR